MKGIILAGGAGTRLYPSTMTLSKQLLPIYDKPMIYYPLATLMLAGIREVLIISTPQDMPRYQAILGSGSQIGLHLSYRVQEQPRGIAQAFIIGADYLGRDEVCLILGDNVFYGQELPALLQHAAQAKAAALVFAYRVPDPGRYGVIEFDEQGRALSIEEKPRQPRSNYAVPGLYFYDRTVVQLAKSLTPSQRGELEITDINMKYLEQNKLQVALMDRGIAWLDTGTPESLLEAANFIAVMEKRLGLKIGCIEETALKMGYIDKNQLAGLIRALPKSSYRDYLALLL